MAALQNSLKQDEVEELQAAFNLFSNKKKELDADDLKAIMRQLGEPCFCLLGMTRAAGWRPDASTTELSPLSTPARSRRQLFEKLVTKPCLSRP